MDAISYVSEDIDSLDVIFFCISLFLVKLCLFVLVSCVHVRYFPQMSGDPSLFTNNQ